ncbi:MAG TPA: sigma 54-interacting transcriptional regulator [Sandaracinaceae bacterium LLY-WYZ-13_1]|nr:sigma 54-interacting transcriptional regulator [Sandaracinaceae bacterium LLY-WYZ-13_1]
MMRSTGSFVWGPLSRGQAPDPPLRGDSSAAVRLRELVGKLAHSPAKALLIRGEPGTEKEEVVRALHAASDRRDRPLVLVHCAHVGEEALEQLFVPAPPGAPPGPMDLAEGGTLFLEEIATTPGAARSKVLTFLEAQREGGDAAADVRLVASTSAAQRDVGADALLRHLSVLSLHVPALRDRASDIPALVRAFVERFARELCKDVGGVAAATLDRLSQLPWPGNDRELRNAVERAVLLAEGPELGDADFGAVLGAGAERRSLDLPPEGLDWTLLERRLLIQALQRTGGNQTRAGTLLGMNRDQVRYRVAKFGLDLTRLDDLA